MSKQPPLWVMVPAAGAGSRIGADRPKQYLALAGTSILDITLANLLDHPRVQGVVISLAENDGYFGHSAFATDARVVRVAGGAERCHSVLNGLNHLATFVAPQQSVLVHDAARPCVSHVDIDKLIDVGLDSSDGAVLGAKVRDSMKSVDSDGRIQDSVPRDRLWHAFTPQMFPLGKLIAALASCENDGVVVTDESSAIQRCGYHPLMVAGSSHNIKITFSEDLAVAESILYGQGRLAR